MLFLLGASTAVLIVCMRGRKGELTVQGPVTNNTWDLDQNPGLHELLKLVLSGVSVETWLTTSCANEQSGVYCKVCPFAHCIYVGS